MGHYRLAPLKFYLYAHSLVIDNDPLYSHLAQYVFANSQAHMISKFRKAVLKTSRTILRPHWVNLEARMTDKEYGPEHIKNLQVLHTRKTLLDVLPKAGVAAEIGVNRGDFSAEILNRNKPRKLHLVDIWGSTRYHDGLRQHVESRFAEQRAAGQLEIHIGLSTDVGHQFPDNYFDWIYIDTDHSFKTTLSELMLYASKVKKDGFICGHDYIIGNWKGMVRYGVIEAVTHFCVTQGYELVYLTTERRGHPSFAIRKMV